MYQLVSMSISFNLWKLHRISDVHPRSWICIGGGGLTEILHSMEKEIEKDNNLTREHLSRITSNRLGCNSSVIKTILRGRRECLPIPVVLEMADMCKDGKSYLNELHSKTEFLKVNSASAKPIRALKNAPEELYKIIGAFMADGCLTYQIAISAKGKSDLNFAKAKLKSINTSFSESYSEVRSEHFLSLYASYKNFTKIENLMKTFSKNVNIQTHTNMEIIDEHKDGVEAFNNWMEMCFGIKPTIFAKRTNENAWRSIYSNKILGRYLVAYFDVRPGYKTDIAFEPEVINKSPLKYRKLFALGILTFDGSATITGNVSFSSKSRNLFNSICDILSKCKINFGTSISRGEFNVNVWKNSSRDTLFNFFEKGTTKWFRLKSSYTSIKTDKDYLQHRTFGNTKVTFEELKRLLTKVRTCDVNFLKEHFDCNHTTVMSYLNIMKNNGNIKLSAEPSEIDTHFVDPKTSVLLKEDFHNRIFKLIEENFSEYKEFAKYMNIHKANVSSWKVRKNRIPLIIVKKFCNVLGLEETEIGRNIEDADRRIVEFIS